MKKVLIIFFFLIFSSHLPAQILLDPYDIYYGRQPSARAEAMGRGMVANSSNEFASFYNPASSSFTHGINFNFSHSTKYYNDKNANFNYEGVSYDLKKGRGNIGLSRYYMGAGNELNGDNFNYTFYTINYSRHVIYGFYAGANLNIINSHIPGYESHRGYILPENVTAASVDIGAIKTFNLTGKSFRGLLHEINLGASVTNVSFTVLQSFFGRQNLPVLLRVGGAYNVRFYNFMPTDNEKGVPGFTYKLNLLVHLEMEKELRYDNHDIYKAGAEATIYEILSLRGGFYSNWYSGGYKYNYFTYGAGINIPINKLTHGDYPFGISIDYANMKQPATRDYGRFNILSMKLNWIPD